MNELETLSEEQLDFLLEMMNIGAGNAATAFRQMLQADVNMTIPRVHAVTPPEAPTVIPGGPSSPVACVKMTMVGDVTGDLFFVVPERSMGELARLVETATPGPKTPDRDSDLAVLAEIGNILAGVYTTALHDFCKLSLYTSVPTAAVDMIQSLLDESIAVASREAKTLFLFEHELSVTGRSIQAFFLLIPTATGVQTLVASIESARMAYGQDED